MLNDSLQEQDETHTQAEEDEEGAFREEEGCEVVRVTMCSASVGCQRCEHQHFNTY